MLPEFIQGCSGGQRKPEFLTWVALCIAHGAKSYVELGTGHAEYMVKAGIPSVVGVDINNLDGAVCGGSKHIRGDSHDPETLRRVLDLLGEPPDVVFIDADHNDDAPRLDFELWWPVTQKLMGFHDILIPNIEQRVWPSVSLHTPSAKIIACDAESAIAWQGPGAPKDGILSAGGIGVLFK